MDIFLAILAILFASLVLNVILKHFTIPPIIGYIFVGVAAKAAIDFDGSSALTTSAEFGIVFLMFMLGLEFSVSHMVSMKKEVFGIGSIQMVGTTIIIFGISYFLFGFSDKESLVVGLTLALSSTAIVIKLLQDSKSLHRNHGRISLGILLFQDMAVVPIFIMIAIFADKSQSLSSLLGQTLFNSLSVMVIIYIFGKYVVSYFLKFVSSAQSSELFMSAVLLVVLTSAYIAHYFSISYSLGAFIAGMLLAESQYKYQIEADLTPFRDLFLGLFFLSVGLMIDLEYVLEHFDWILLITLAIMGIKMGYLYLVGIVFYTKRTAIKAAILLAQVGEFSFVVLSLAKENHIIGNDVTQILIATVVVSMVMTPFLAKYVTPISYRFTDDKKEGEILRKTQHYHNHVVVIGYGNVGKRIVDKLKVQGLPHIVIEFKKDLVYDGQAKGIDVVFGNATKLGILDKVSMDNASIAIVTSEDSDELLRICALISFRYPHVHLVARAKNDKEYGVLASGRQISVIDQSDHISDLLLAKAMGCKI
jgi:CPA2 family monovalent cation:H+ antiporter-2